MAKPIMIQGTMSNVGKSLLCAGLCRVFKQDGYRVSPFKSQNMALNSFITREGLEMGRAQVVQAEACGVEPSVLMNPILLKPVTDMGSQVIVNGEVLGNMKANEYFAMKKSLIPDILNAYNTLADKNDIIVIEGAGSPAEINLKQEDIVNMGMARMVQAPVLLVGDIDRGGVFAQLAGTLMLLDKVEQDLVKALVINKFRGDVEILRPGLTMLHNITNKPIAGVLPYLQVDIEDEDSLSQRFVSCERAMLDIAVIRLPRISNFTDFAALEAEPYIGIRYVAEEKALGNPDMIILPGTKNTISDLLWLRQNGLEAAIKKRASCGTVIFGICGGYQMLGKCIVDACGVEGGGAVSGMDLLPICTEFQEEKHRTRIAGKIIGAEEQFAELTGITIEGYEIHMGKTTLEPGTQAFVLLDNGLADGCVKNNIAGSYLHGFFDSAECRGKLVKMLSGRKGIILDEVDSFDYDAYKEQQYDFLADAIRKSLDMEMVYRILEEGA